MIQKIRSLIFTLAATLTLVIPILAVPAMVHAAPATGTGPDIQGQLCQGSSLQFSSTATDCSDTSTAQDSVNHIVTLVINIFSVVVSIIAVIMIIIGGIKYITSGGDSANVTSAKNTILYAIIGLVVVALSQILVRYVLARVTSQT